MKIRRGESIFYNFKKSGEAPTSNQICEYEIQNGSGVKILAGMLELEDNTYKLRITSEETKLLPIGTHLILVSFQDLDSGYMDYIMDTSLVVFK